MRGNVFIVLGLGESLKDKNSPLKKIQPRRKISKSIFLSYSHNPYKKDFRKWNNIPTSIKVHNIQIIIKFSVT
jgi:hypothetical protein